MTVTVRPVAAADRGRWGELYAAYAGFYEIEQSEAMRERVWGWLMDGAHEVEGLVALDDTGRIVGIAHFRAYARPLTASIGGFLDDLFVEPHARGSGAARALIQAVGRIGRERGWTIVRWITADDNYRARTLYDRVATRMPWITYDMKLG